MAESERRRAIRFDSVNWANYGEKPREDELTAEEFSDAFKGAETIDLSVSGARIRITDRLPVGAEFTFDLMLDDYVISPRARIVRRRQVHEGWVVGITFLDLEPMQRDGIALFLHESGAQALGQDAASG